MLTNTIQSWGFIAKSLHWLLALLIIGMLIFGTYMTGIPDDRLAEKFQLYQWHKSFGLLAFVFIALRLAWRAVQPTPALPADSPAYVRLGSKFSHIALYVLMFALPVSGYLMTSVNTFGIPTVAFGVIPIPHILGADAGLEKIFKEIHEISGNLLIAVLLLHVAAAVKHGFIDRDGILQRMWFGKRSSEAA